MLKKMDFEVRKSSRVRPADGIGKAQIELSNQGKIGKSKITLQLPLEDADAFPLGSFFRIEIYEVSAPGTPASDTNLEE